MNPTCPRCMEQTAITLDVCDADTLRCGGCDEEYSLDAVRELIASWGPLLAWVDLHPSRQSAEAPPTRSVEATQALARLERLAADPAKLSEAEQLFHTLAAGSFGLRAECRRVIAVHGTDEINERLAGHAAVSSPPEPVGV